MGIYIGRLAPGQPGFVGVVWDYLALLLCRVQHWLVLWVAWNSPRHVISDSCFPFGFVQRGILVHLVVRRVAIPLSLGGNLVKGRCGATWAVGVG